LAEAERADPTQHRRKPCGGPRGRAAAAGDELPCNDRGVRNGLLVIMVVVSGSLSAPVPEVAGTGATLDQPWPAPVADTGIATIPGITMRGEQPNGRGAPGYFRRAPVAAAAGAPMSAPNRDAAVSDCAG